jgi:flagellar biosynthesis/type III secretory pathway protein FliH
MRDLQRNAPVEIVRLAMLAARKIVDAEIRQDPETLLAMLKRVIRFAHCTRPITLTAHPDVVTELEPQLRDGSLSVRWRRDTSLDRGDLRVDTNAGSLRAGSREQVRAMERAMLQAIRGTNTADASTRNQRRSSLPASQERSE